MLNINNKNRTKYDIYFNLSIYIQLIVGNKTHKHSMHKWYYMKIEKNVRMKKII